MNFLRRGSKVGTPPKSVLSGTAASTDGPSSSLTASSPENQNQNQNSTKPTSQYQSLPDADLNLTVKPNNSVTESTPPNNYKGFNTSITHMFTNHNTARSDCCSLACCGMLQSDYNRYILYNRRPPTFRNRFIQYILIPLILFCLAGYSAVMIEDVNLNQVAVWFCLTLTVGWILGGCLRSNQVRSSMREELLRKKMGISKGVIYDSQDEMDLDQTVREMACAHRMCGCYATDLSDEETYLSYRHHGDLYSCLSRMFALLCCGRLCKYHWQICGICAVAQEARQIDALVSIDRRRMDYVTLQSYFDYFNEIRKLRAEKNGKLLDHYMALSKLSRMMIKTLFFVIIILSLFSVAVAPKDFHWTHMLVFVATFIQAFFILYFVHWHWNRLDLSLDAVIKYFACGFIITTTTAICFELLESLFLNIVARVLMQIVGLDIENNDYGYGNPINVFEWGLGASVNEERKRAFQRQYPIISVMFLFFSAYFIAALVEESCKYFGFKMVEHPDFVSDADLEKAVALGVFEDDEDDDDDRYECGGGFECGDGLYDEDDDEGGGDLEHPTRLVISRFLDDPILENNVRGGTAGNGGGGEGDDGVVKDVPLPKQVDLLPCPPKSVCSTGAAITIAMVTVSLGFACCENLIYIFLYNSGGLSVEIAVLISRSLFPVHPLCAAIQSIGVCRQQLENDRSIGTGRIIFPALLLHGSYDFSIMVFNFLANQPDDMDENEMSALSLIYSLCAFATSVLFVIGGALYYFRESKRQKARLEQIDAARNFVGVSCTSTL